MTVIPTERLRPAAAASEPPPARPRWPRLLAAAIVGQPVLLMVNSIFHPEVEIDAASILAGAAEGPNRWFAVHVVAALGSLLGAPAALGLRRLVCGRGRTLADAAVGAACVAAGLLSMSFAIEGSLLRLLTTTDVSERTALAVVDAYTSTVEFYAVGVGVLAATAGTLLLAIALWREAVVPRRLAWLLGLGSLATLVGPPGTVITPAGFALVAAASIGLARRV